jgi:hypothetical protein
VNTGGLLPDGPLVVDLQSTSISGQPSGQVLATASVPAQPCCTSVAWLQFALQPVVPITAGTSYALTLRAPDFSSVPTYDGGSTVRVLTLTRPETGGSSIPRSGWELTATSPSGPTSIRLGSGPRRPARSGAEDRRAESPGEARASPRPDRAPTEIARPCARRAPAGQHRPREPLAASIRQPRRRPTGQATDGRAGAAAI